MCEKLVVAVVTSASELLSKTKKGAGVEKKLEVQKLVQELKVLR